MKRHLQPLVWLGLGLFTATMLFVGLEPRPISTAQFGPVCPAPEPTR